MVEPITDMPAGTLGFKLSGRVTKDEYFRIVEPIRAKLEAGEKVSFLVETDAGFDGLDAGALWEDAKAAGSMGLKYRQFWPYELIGAAAWSAWWLFLGAAGGVVIDRFGDVGHYRAWLLLASGLAAVYLLWHYRADLRRFLRDEPEAT